MELNTIKKGNCIEELKKLPSNSVDLIFADPPYNLQLEKNLHRPNERKYDGVDNDWDKFSSMQSYDSFTKEWLVEAKRVLKNSGTIWVIGTYHNIYRVGKILQDLDYWILNDIVWIKTNPTPNFRGSRFNNAHETLLWAKKSKQSSYTFNYQVMKKINDNLQMRSDWFIPICQGEERVKINGKKAHPTQKPEALLRRVILSSTNIGDLVLDPFFGTGTTGVVAKKLKRNWIGIEVDKTYVKIAKSRIDNTIAPDSIDDKVFTTFSRRKLPKVSFSRLVEVGMLNAGQTLYSSDKKFHAIVKSDGTLLFDGKSGSIHKMAAVYMKRERANGWDFWFYSDGDLLHSINRLRNQYRKLHLGIDIEEVLE